MFQKHAKFYLKILTCDNTFLFLFITFIGFLTSKTCFSNQTCQGASLLRQNSDNKKKSTNYLPFRNVFNKVDVFDGCPKDKRLRQFL